MTAPRKTHRKLRISWNEPGHAHELTFSCQHRWPLLSRDRTRTWLVEALDRARRRWAFSIWAYVIMPEHVHILIHPQREDYNIGNILKAIKQPVAQAARGHCARISASNAPLTSIATVSIRWRPSSPSYSKIDGDGGSSRLD